MLHFQYDYRTRHLCTTHWRWGVMVALLLFDRISVGIQARLRSCWSFLCWETTALRAARKVLSLTKEQLMCSAWARNGNLRRLRPLCPALNLRQVSVVTTTCNEIYFQSLYTALLIINLHCYIFSIEFSLFIYIFFYGSSNPGLGSIMSIVAWE